MSTKSKGGQFHRDIPSGWKVKFNPASTIEFSETAVFLYFKETLHKRATLDAYLTDLALNFFYAIFADASLRLLYHGAKK